MQTCLVTNNESKKSKTVRRSGFHDSTLNETSTWCWMTCPTKPFQVLFPKSTPQLFCGSGNSSILGKQQQIKFQNLHLILNQQDWPCMQSWRQLNDYVKQLISQNMACVMFNYFSFAQNIKPNLFYLIHRHGT